MEAEDKWSTSDVKMAVKKFTEIRPLISWAPLLEPQLQEWEELVKGAAMEAGVEVNDELRTVKDRVQDAEEKGA